MLLLWLLTIGVTILNCYAESSPDDNHEAIAYLKGLQIEDLANVEVVLDDVFDVFDGLIKARKTTIATGDTQSTARAPSVTSVITSQDMEAIGATDLDEALETVPGLHVRRDNLRYNPIYAIRGLSSTSNPEVLTLINGIPINNLFYGDRSNVWGGMPINAISRIEIIRGPGSAVYGADAYSGVINIITKTKEDINGTESGVRLGSFNTEDAWILHGSQWAGFDLAFALEYHDTDGQRETIEADAQTAFDQLFGTHASFAPGPVNLALHSIESRLDLSRGKWRMRMGVQDRGIGNGAGMAQALDPVGHYLDNRFNADLTYSNPNFTNYWDVTAQVSHYRTKLETRVNNWLYPPGAFGGTYPEGFIGNPQVSESHTRFDLSGFYSGFPEHLLRVGTGYHYSEMYKVRESKNFGIDPSTGQPLSPGSPVIDDTDTPFIFTPERDRRNWYVYLQDIWKVMPNWELTTGIRYDDYSDFGSTVNPRLALVWQPRPNLTSKLLYGRAFRAPSSQEQFVTNNPVQQGNPNLKPETIETWELAVDYRATEKLHLAWNLFTYQARDKIGWAPDPHPNPNLKAPPLLAQNIHTQDGYGLEVEARWKMSPKSSLLVNYSYQQATDENDHQIGNDPQHSAYLRTDWLLIPNWFLDTQVNWVAHRQRQFGDPRPPIDDYTTIDLTLRRKDIKAGHWNFALGVRNLLDADAREPSTGPDSNGMIAIPHDLPLAGRNYFLELRYHF
jgi:iron complex outermembrane receptor protein